MRDGRRLLSQWKLEAEFRNSDFFATDQTLKKTFQFLLTFILHLPHCFQEKLTVEVIEVGRSMFTKGGLRFW